ncbi:TolC family protein [Sphingopyxis fribergensis]
MTSASFRMAVGLALCLPGAASAQDLASAIADARAHSPALAAAAADADAAAARVAQARAAAGPTARIEGSVGIGRLDPGGYFGLAAAGVTPSALQLVGEYPLYAGGRINAAIDQARAGSNAAALGKDMARQNLTLGTVSAYAEVLTARELVTSYGKLVDALGEIVRHTGLRYDVGDATSSEVAQAKARHAEGRAGLVQSEGRLATAEARLERLTGVPVGALAPLPPRPAVPASLGEAVEAATLANVLLAQAGSGIDGAEARVRAARASNRPTVGVFAEAGRIRDQFFPDYRNDNVTVGVRGRWTFFDSGAGSARVREAQAGLSASEARLRLARDDVTQAVIEAWTGLDSAEKSLDAAHDGEAAAREALRGTRLEVRSGARPPLAELDAEREAIAATARLAEAEAMAQVAAWRLRLLCGWE